ncbi:hypothetical protein KM043_005873 [Ampulex compressa]|nr:hypothetical protein KM043_005873 [Ampulex compressa]
MRSSYPPHSAKLCLGHRALESIKSLNGWVDEGGPWNATKEIITPDNSTTYNIENLSPFTVYSFRVAAVNAMGRSKPSQESFYIVTLRERTSS